MSIDTYGLCAVIDEDRYLEIFEDKARFLFITMRALVSVARENDVDLNGWPHDVIWKMYESITYDANIEAVDEARILQKTENPEKSTGRFYDPITGVLVRI
jgi:hypothetical protein